jgi:hypothetical protein
VVWVSLEVSSDDYRYGQVGIVWATGEGKVNGKGKGEWQSAYRRYDIGRWRGV